MEIKCTKCGNMIYSADALDKGVAVAGDECKGKRDNLPQHYYYALDNLRQGGVTKSGLPAETASALKKWKWWKSATTKPLLKETGNREVRFSVVGKHFFNAVVGWVLLIIGIISFMDGFIMDPSTETDIGATRVNNIGLLQQKQELLFLGFGFAGLGVLMLCLDDIHNTLRKEKK